MKEWIKAHRTQGALPSRQLKLVLAWNELYRGARVRPQCGQLSVNLIKGEYLSGSEHQCRTRIRGGARKNDAL